MTLLRRKHIKPGEKVLLSLAVSQVDLIIEHLPIQEGLLDTLYHSRVWDGIVKVRCSLAELAELVGYVETEVLNTTDIRLREAFEAIAQAITKVEQCYWVRPKLVRVALRSHPDHDIVEH
ncbi:hypothetical protein [Propionivibrio sp.]|uniref:hypothetical protein n=1 Tax=Propionivibrio sp. TaxID=2212460 RepID=UPI003BF2EA3B